MTASRKSRRVFNNIDMSAPDSGGNTYALAFTWPLVTLESAHGDSFIHSLARRASPHKHSERSDLDRAQWGSRGPPLVVVVSRPEGLAVRAPNNER